MKKIACIFLAAGLYAQIPQFEVASMKLVPAGQPSLARTSDGAQLRYPSASLLSLLRDAWRLKRPEQIDGPAWIRTQLYNIQAKLPPNSSKGQIPEMLQALLADELKLAVHHEMRPLPANVLLVAGKSPGKPTKMHQVAEQDEILDLKMDLPLVHLSGQGSISQLIDQLNHGLGGPHPWVDMTGLTGFFNIKLDFDMTPESSLAQKQEGPSVPMLAQALDEQLGLRVEVRKTPTDVIVVDHVERVPAEN